MIVKYNPEFVFNTVEKYLRNVGALKKDSTRDDLRKLVDSLGADDAMALVFEAGESYGTSE